GPAASIAAGGSDCWQAARATVRASGSRSLEEVCMGLPLEEMERGRRVVRVGHCGTGTAPTGGDSWPPGGKSCAHSILAASSKDSRGERGYTAAGSPRPRLTSTLERIEVPLKKASSTLALSKPVIGPVSSPS